MADIFFLGILAVFGGWIMYEDFKKGRIRNCLLLVLIGAGFFLNYYTGSFVNQPLPFFINIFSGIMVGLIIWFAGLWSAADAKLYISLVIFFPISWFSSSIGYFPGLAILVNSAVPLFLFLTGQILVQTNWKEKIRTATNILKFPIIVNIFTIGTGIIILRRFILSFFKINLDYFLTIPLFLGIFWVINKLKIKVIYFFTTIIVLSFIFYPQFIDTLFFIKVSIFSSLIILAIWIISLSQHLFSSEVKIKDLKEGMILNEMVFKKDQHFVKQPIAFLTFLTSLTQRMKSKPVFGYNPDGLKVGEISNFQEMKASGQLDFETIRISKTLPFALILILGILITYFIKDSIFVII
ncbi:MAG: A24 family peptidase C-terminal domain-containing protein [Candidatus Nealsonbacteria bacterium]